MTLLIIKARAYERLNAKRDRNLVRRFAVAVAITLAFCAWVAWPIY